MQLLRASVCGRKWHVCSSVRVSLCALVNLCDFWSCSDFEWVFANRNLSIFLWSNGNTRCDADMELRKRVKLLGKCPDFKLTQQNSQTTADGVIIIRRAFIRVNKTATTTHSKLSINAVKTTKTKNRAHGKKISAKSVKTAKPNNRLKRCNLFYLLCLLISTPSWLRFEFPTIWTANI